MYSNNGIEFCVKSALRPYRVIATKSSNPLPPLQSTRILDQIRERIRYLHFSRSTEDAYLYWCRFFIRWSGTRHPREMGAKEVEAFLSGGHAKRVGIDA